MSPAPSTWDRAAEIRPAVQAWAVTAVSPCALSTWSTASAFATSAGSMQLSVSMGFVLLCERKHPKSVDFHQPRRACNVPGGSRRFESEAKGDPMEQFLIDVFGVQNHLTTAQEGARAVLIFSYGLLLLRASGPRMFGHWSALDIVISIMVGSALARAMTGSAPLVGTMVAAAIMAALHVSLAHAVARN